MPATREKLRQATDSMQLADAEGTVHSNVIIPDLLLLFSVNGQSRETEAVKLISVRAGLLDMSQAWEGLGNKCSLLAQAQKVR